MNSIHSKDSDVRRTTQPSAPPSAQLAALLAESVHSARRRYRKRLGRCQKKCSEKAVHALRVETRRMFAVLDLLNAWNLETSAEHLATRFKKRFEVFGDLRDTQVQLGLLKPLWPQFPEAQPLKTFLQRREEKIAGKVASRIKAAKHSGLNRRLKEIEHCLRKLADSKTGQDGATAARAALKEAHERVEALRRRVRPDDTATFHQMRIAFKRFRYMSELLQPLLPRITGEQLDRMRKYQNSAGDIQDIEVLQHRLGQAVKQRRLNPAAIRNLRGELLRQKLRAIDCFMARIADLSRFKTVFARPATRKPRVQP